MRFTLDSRLRGRLIFGTLLPSVLVISGVAFLAPAMGEASPVSENSRSTQETVLGRFPLHAASCVRKYLPPQVLLDAATVAPDPDKMIASWEPHRRAIMSVADRCGFAVTEQGGQQIGHIVSNLSLSGWSKTQLAKEFSISPDQLSTAMGKVSPADLAKIGAIPTSPHASDAQLAAFAPVLRRISAELGLKDERATLLLSAYIVSTARLAPRE